MSDGRTPAPAKVPVIRDADVRLLAAKLKGLHALLTPAEGALLRLVLRRAAGRADHASAPAAPPDIPDTLDTADVTDDAWAVSFNPLTYLDAVAAERPRAGARRRRQGDRRGRP